MTSNDVEKAAQQIAEPILNELGFELVEITFKKEFNEWYLSIFIDKPGGITLDDCEKVHGIMDPLLDESADIREQHDYLIVSSPGLDRPISTDKDWQRAIGKELEIKLYVPVQKKKKIIGILTAYDAQNIMLTIHGASTTIARKDISLARQAIKFE